ncbi:hypothetical protein O9G_001383 [Rozella allomycis CSF55]|uniref:Uncharacterized protein n=1 Tax=Rozella allomycis (strain CSF55) TaxID=988480 RepID=A0A075B2V6_ROZAC|nr:hypothetical protein O9G_001383 [Rozella allomycis CSF55]|eukprot:EPZ36938.1 hypothetical protein O9G_001383 [Rozella allomycis CSF55]
MNDKKSQEHEKFLDLIDNYKNDNRYFAENMSSQLDLLTLNEENPQNKVETIKMLAKKRNSSSPLKNSLKKIENEEFLQDDEITSSDSESNCDRKLLVTTRHRKSIVSPIRLKSTMQLVKKISNRHQPTQVPYFLKRLDSLSNRLFNSNLPTFIDSQIPISLNKQLVLYEPENSERESRLQSNPFIEIKNEDDAEKKNADVMDLD